MGDTDLKGWKMGVKQQHRINALNREMFDRSAKPGNLTDALQNRVDMLAHLCKAQAAQLETARDLIATLQRDRERLINERNEQTARGDWWHKQSCGMLRSVTLYKKRWQYVSRLLRLLPASRVNELRNELGGVTCES